VHSLLRRNKRAPAQLYVNHQEGAPLIHSLSLISIRPGTILRIVRRAVIGSLIIVTVSTLTGFTDVDGPSDFCDAVHDGHAWAISRPDVLG
jgi:cobalamin synthase